MNRLRSEEDAFGQEMWAYYKGEEASEIVERDDGFFNVTPNNPAHYFSARSTTMISDDGIEIGLCKETMAVWRAQRMNPSKISVTVCCRHCHA